MKILFDYFPIICFFIAYKLWGIYIATLAAMGASTLQVGYYWLRHHRFEKLHVITLGFILVLGGFTLILHNPIYIKWKPSIIYWIFSIALFSHTIFKNQPLMKKMLGKKMTMPDKIWRNFTNLTGLFFFGLGFLNLWVVYHYSTNAWVNFKLFGTLGLTLLFFISVGIYISRFASEPDTQTTKKNTSENE